MGEDRRAPVKLDDDVLELLGSGVVIYVGTRDAALSPDLMWAMGVRVAPERNWLTLFMPVQGSAATVANARANGQLAVTFSRPFDHKSVQVKGTLRQVRDSGAEDRAAQEFYRAALVEQFAIIGVPRSLTKRIPWWPSVAIEMSVLEVYTQTPGPNAGAPIGGGP